MRGREKKGKKEEKEKKKRKKRRRARLPRSLSVIIGITFFCKGRIASSSA